MVRASLPPEAGAGRPLVECRSVTKTTFGSMCKRGAATIFRMEQRDSWGVAVVGCAILGLISAGITATVVRFPNGGYDMQGMWTIAAAGFAAWVVSTSIVAALWVRARWRTRVSPRGQ